MSFNLEEELGGKDSFQKIITIFYDRLFADPIVGFIFSPHEKNKLIVSQMGWLSSTLGDRSGTYEGKNLRVAHQDLAITSGQFNRRHTILAELLDEFVIPEHVKEAWLNLDRGLFDMIVKLGKKNRNQKTDAVIKTINLLDD